MIRSMTGYGGAKGTVEGLSVTVELRSVNNRYLDIAVRMPRNFLFAEDAVKSTIQQHVSRGKLDVFVTIDSSQAEDTVLRVNEPLLRAYIDTLNALAVRYDLKNDMSLMSLMRFPDILSVEKAEADQDKIRAGLIELTQQALADYDQMREREGEKLRADVAEKLARIESLVAQVETAAPETAAAYETRLRQKLEAVLAATDIDESRIIAEAAIFADHVAVDEETVRLRSHIAQLRHTLVATASCASISCNQGELLCQSKNSIPVKPPCTFASVPEHWPYGAANGVGLATANLAHVLLSAGDAARAGPQPQCGDGRS